MRDTILNLSHLRTLLLACLLVFHSNSWSQSMTQLWGSQTDMANNDAVTCMVYDTINNFGYLALYARNFEDDEDLFSLYLPDAMTNFNDAGDDDIILLKYGSNGELYWAISIGGGQRDVATGICVDNQGNVYLVGGYKGNLIFSSLTVENAAVFPDDGGGGNTSQAFICSYSPSGQFRWAKNEGGTGDDAFHSITNTSSGVVAMGHFTENNSESIQGINITSPNDDTDLFVAKYSHSGANTWILAGGSSEPDFNTSYALEESRWDITSYNDTVYFAGVFTGLDFHFDYATNTTSTNTTQTITSGDIDADYVLGSIDPNGKLNWLQRQIQYGTNPIKTISIAADCNGVFLGGIAQAFLIWEGINPGWKATTGGSDMFITSYEKSNGAPKNWLIIPSPNADTEIVYELITDKRGNIFFAGTSTNSLQIGSTTIPAFSSGAAFVISLNSNLAYQSHAIINSTSTSEIAFTLCLQENNNLFFGGTSNGNLIAGQSGTNSTYDGFIYSYSVISNTSSSCCVANTFSCPTTTSVLYSANNCAVALPNYLNGYTSSCPNVTLSQTPPPGTNLGVGLHSISIWNNTTLVCTLSVEVKDTIYPTIICPASQYLYLDANCSVTLPDYRSLATVTDNCTSSANLVITQTPAAGTLLTGSGTTQVTLTVTDAAGLSTPCTFVVSRFDNTPPSIDCSLNHSLPLNSSCTAILPAYRTLVNITDNCSANANILVTQTPPPGTIVSGVGVTEVTLTAIDEADQVSTCIINVNRIDDTPPVITCPAAQTLQLNASCAGVLGDYRSLATKSDNCSSAANIIITQSPAAGTAVSGVGTTVVTLTATDASNNTASCTFNVNRVDITPPAITCPAAQTLQLNASCAGVLGDYRSLATKSDNCSTAANIIITQSPAVGTAVTGVGTTVVTLTATDASNNTASCTFNVNRVDITPPAITCPAAQTLQLNASCAGVLGDYRSLATKSDNCSTAANIVITQSPAVGTAVTGVGTTVVTLTATDASNNTASCTFNVNRVDNLRPNLTNPGNQILTLGNACTGVLGDYRNLFNATDNCTQSANLVVTQSPSPGTGVTGVGAINVSVTATDQSGNSTINWITVVPRPSIGPTITNCPGNISAQAGVNCQTAVTFGNPTISPACSTCFGPTTITGFTYMGSFNNNKYFRSNTTTRWQTADSLAYALGGHLVTITSEAENVFVTNNTANIKHWIGLTDEVIDGTFKWTNGELAPYTNWNSGEPNNQSGDQDYGTINHNTAGQWDDEDMTDSFRYVIEFDCPSITLSSGMPSGSAFPIGTTQQTFTATDQYGTSSSCSFNVVITDITPPAITCPAAQTLQLNSSCVGVLGDYRSLATISDNCSTAANIIITQSPAAGTAVTGVGTTVVTLTATDASNNTASCTFNVNRVDITPPAITCPATQTLQLNASCAGVLGDYRSLATKSDNCSTAANIIITQSPAVGTAVTGVGTTVVTLTATDASNNISSCTFNVNRVDITPPAITCPAAQTLQLNASCAGVLGDYRSLATKSDNCSTAANIVITQSPAVGTAVSGVGTTVVTLTATDASNNTASCTFNVNRVDIIPPGITCPAAQTLQLNASCAGVLGDYRSLATKSDNCSTAANIIITQSPAIGTAVTGVGTTVVTLTATDASNNTASCTFNVNRVDITPPAITCPGNQTVSSTGACSGTLGNYVGLTSATDNCATAGSIIISQSPAAGTSISAATTVTMTATDTNGNASTCTFLVTPLDNTPPSITCPSAQTLTLNSSCAGTLGNYTTLATKSDNCTPAGSIVVTQSPATGTAVSGIGTTIVTLTATDAAGNIATCTFNVNRVDNSPPVITCPAAQTLQLNASCAGVIGDYRSLATKSDNCSAAANIIITQSPAVGTAVSGVGTTVVTLTATDASNNTASCTFNVNRVDITPPAITCPAAQTLQLNASCAGVLGDYRSLATKSDNCSAAANIVITQSPAVGTAVTGVGTTVVTLTATDASNNTASCTFNVNRVDITPPNITCPAAQTLELNASCTGVIGDYRSFATKSDNCSSAANIIISQSPAVGTAVSGVGTTVVTLTATDASNNTASCTFNVNRVDITPPVITCPAAQTLQLNASCAGVLGDYRSLATKSDNCSTAANIIITQSPAVGTAVTGVGTTVVTLTATDSSNNTASCTFNVNRVDITPPVITCPAAQTLPLNASCAAVLGDYTSLATISDNCSNAANIIITQSPAVGTAVTGVGTTVVTLTATDASNNTASCTFNVNRVDITPPSIICWTNQTIYLNELGNASTPNYVGNMTITDNCSITSSIVKIQNPQPATQLTGTGVQIITITAIDVYGNTSSCTFELNKVDSIAPQITCLESQTIPLSEDCTIVLPDYRNQLNATDNVTGQEFLVINQSPNPGTVISGIGTTEVTLTAIDASNNVSSCTFDLERIDLSTLSISCPLASDLYNNENCSVIIPDYRDQVTVAENCTPNTSTTLSQFPDAGTSIANGQEVLITIYASNSLDQYDTCSFYVNIIDTIAPVVFCPSEVINILLNENCQGNIPDLTTIVEWTDNCSSSLLFEQQPAADVIISAPGVQDVTLIASDDSGNSRSCIAQINFIPTGEITLVCPANQSAYLDANCQISLPDYLDQVEVIQPCYEDTSLSWTQWPPYEYVLDGELLEEISLIVHSELYGSTSCSFDLTTIAQIENYISCQEEIELFANENCTATLPDLSGLMILENDCIQSHHLSFEQTPAIGNDISGNTIVEIEYAYLGQLATCSTQIIFVDTLAPTLVCPEGPISASFVECNFVVPDLTTSITAVDNCTMNSSLTWTQQPAAGQIIDQNLTVSIVVSDDSGNSASCQVSLVIDNNAGAGIVCPNQVELSTNENCEILVANTLEQVQIESDCFYATSWVQTPAANEIWMGNYSAIEVSATLNNDEILTCEIPVVISVESPVLSCPNTIDIPYASACENTMQDYTSEVAVDFGCNNAIAFTWQQTPSPNSIFTDPTSSEIEFLLIDENGIGYSCSSSITYSEIINYSVDCPAQIVIQTDSDCSYIVPEVSAQLLNNCGQNIEFLTQQSPQANEIANANDFDQIILTSSQYPSYTCLVPVIYEIELPILPCPEDTTIYLTNLEYTIGNMLPLSSYTNCAGLEWSISQSPAVGEIINATTILEVNYMVTNDTVQVCQSTIYLIQEEETTTVICPDTVDISMGANCTIEDIDILNEISNFTVISNSTYQWNFIDNNQIYGAPQTIELTATTTNNTSASCIVTFVPIDTQEPQIIATTSNFDVYPDANCTFIIPDLLTDIVANDNCSYSLIQSPVAGSSFSGTTEVTIVATDPSGLTASTIVLLHPILPTPEPLVQLDNTILFISPTTCNLEFNWIDMLQPQGLCSAQTISTTEPYQNIFSVGEYTLGYYGIDPNGNTTDTVYFNLSVQDNSGPQIQHFDNDQLHLCAINDNWETPAIVDCSNYTYEVQQEPFVIGSNLVTINAQDEFDNTASYTFTVIVHDMQWPVIMETTSYCPNADPLTLSNLGFDSVVWSINGEDISEFKPSQYSTGNIELVAEAVDNSCVADTTISITILPMPTHSGLQQKYSICGNTLSIPWQSNSPIIEWSADEFTVVTNDTETITFDTETYGAHAVLLEMTGEFCSSTTSFTVLNDEPILTLDAGNDQLIAYGLDAQLVGTSSIPNIQWMSDDNSISIQQVNSLSTQIDVPQLGNYTLWLHAENGLCQRNDTIHVSFQGLVVPNTLTPNGDQVNDVFIIPGDQTETVHLRIMNRWGQLIFEDTNYKNNWGGANTQGEELPNDTYFYEFTIIGIKTTGFIQIQR